MNNIFKKIKHKVLSLIPFKKITISDQVMRYYLRHKLVFIFAGVVLVVLVYQLLLPYIQSILFVKPRILSRQANDYWAKKDQFYYDPINIVTYADNAILVDVRNAESYKVGHIMSAESIPIDIEKETGDIANQTKVLKAFRELDSKRQIVIYGDNSYSLVPVKTAAFLTQKGIPVKVMSIGWNEFRYIDTFWLPEHLWNKVNIIDFVEGSQVEH